LQLAQWPALQLELLGKILEERKNGVIIDNDLLVLNIALLCKMEHKDEVQFYFLSVNDILNFV
jgi:hypothetical protein